MIMIIIINIYIYILNKSTIIGSLRSARFS